MKLEFYQQIFINYVSHFMKISELGTELFHADGPTDGHMTKLIITFQNFANTSKNLSLWGIELWLSSTSQVTLLTELSRFLSGHCGSDLLYYPH